MGARIIIATSTGIFVPIVGLYLQVCKLLDNNLHKKIKKKNSWGARPPYEKNQCPLFCHSLVYKTF